MEFKEPKVFVIGETTIKDTELYDYLDYIGAKEWESLNLGKFINRISDCELLTEVYSRGCYKSFGVGLNPNITRVRDGNLDHLKNVIESGHGSVLEHCMINFMFCDVSRVFTHELVRHRVGVAISQESLRYVRLTDLKSFDFPESRELSDEDEQWFKDQVKETYKYLEEKQQLMTERFGLNDEKSFEKKKKLTSRMRRLAPLGLLTNIGWSANLRTLRHIIPLRTHKSAEEEMRVVFKEVGKLVKYRYGNVFFDMAWVPDENNTGLGEWRVENRKV